MHVSTVCCVETLRYTLSTSIVVFNTTVVHKVEDGKFFETQQVKLSRAVPHKLEMWCSVAWSAERATNMSPTDPTAPCANKRGRSKVTSSLCDDLFSGVREQKKRTSLR